MARRFTDDEAQRVFARAAARQHAHAPPPDGLTLDELQEIGRAAGLDPAHVAAAASEALAEAEQQQTWHGVPVGTHRSRLLPDRLSDDEWEATVDLLRAEFKTPGVVQQIGRRREWSAGSASGVRAEVTVEARDDGDLVTVRVPDTAKPFGTLMLTSLGAGGLVTFALVSAITGDPRSLAFAAGMALFGAVIYLAAFLAARFRVTRAPERYEALLDRIDLASRAEPARAAPRLDLDALPDAPDAAPATRRRDRA